MERRGGLPWREATTLAIQVAHALEAAHLAGLVHRDLKPQNLFLTSDGELKLLDFGVAMALADTADSEKRQKGFAVFGTPEYMAPEQVAGEPVDARCDLYALGCVLYELVTGARPFEGSPVVVMGKQLREEPTSPRARAPERGLPADIESVIMKALAKSKDDRYPTARAMRDALEHALVAPDRRRSRAKKLMSFAVLASVGVIAAATFKDHSQAIKDLVFSRPAQLAVVPVEALPAAPPIDPVPTESNEPAPEVAAVEVAPAAEPVEAPIAEDSLASSTPATATTPAASAPENAAPAVATAQVQSSPARSRGETNQASTRTASSSDDSERRAERRLGEGASRGPSVLAPRPCVGAAGEH